MENVRPSRRLSPYLQSQHVTLQSQQETQCIHGKVTYPLKAPYGLPRCKPTSLVLYLVMLLKDLNGAAAFFSEMSSYFVEGPLIIEASREHAQSKIKKKRCL